MTRYFQLHQIYKYVACRHTKHHSTHDFNDSGSQFFIKVNDGSGLDRTYTVFGEVFRGMEMVDKIVAAARDDCDNPLQPIVR